METRIYNQFESHYVAEIDLIDRSTSSIMEVEYQTDKHSAEAVE
jgi:hypothetical protein